MLWNQGSANSINSHQKTYNKHRPMAWEDVYGILIAKNNINGRMNERWTCLHKIYFIYTDRQHWGEESSQGSQRQNVSDTYIPLCSKLNKDVCKKPARKLKLQKQFNSENRCRVIVESTRMPEKGKNGLKHNGFSTREVQQTPCTISILCIWNLAFIYLQGL